MVKHFLTQDEETSQDVFDKHFLLSEIPDRSSSEISTGGISRLTNLTMDSTGFLGWSNLRSDSLN